MTTDPDMAERLRRLEGRRGTATPSAVVTPAPKGTSRKRRHAAEAGRVLAIGLSASAFFSGIASFAASTQAGTSDVASTQLSEPTPPTTTQPLVPPTVVVIEEVHHPIYVDQDGNPAAPSSEAVKQSSSVAPSSAVAGESGPSTAPAPSAGPPPTASTPTTPVVTVVTTPPAAPPAPTCSGSKKC
jgi:hypothetical protein